ncbi:MAG: T9SS type A sorting domain-containing protein [Ignavibacteria bacterium]|nr:T9SS type A sorting domain-containing protein [Ignavibacteria bacterium]
MRKIFCFLTLLFFTYTSYTQWIQVSNGMGIDQFVNCLNVKGNLIFAGTKNDGIFLTTNSGNNWSTANIGLSVLNIGAMASDNNTILAGTVNGGLYFSTNNGEQWILATNGISDPNIVSILINGSYIFAGTYNQGIFRSTNNGNTWLNCFNTMRPYSLYMKDGFLFVGTIYNGVFRSSNNGVSWDTTNSGLENVSVFDFTSNGNTLFAGTRKQYNSDTCGVYCSTNNGNSWYPSNGDVLTFDTVYTIVNSGSNIFAGTCRGIFLSTNNGINWSSINQGFTTIPFITDLVITNGYIYAGTINFIAGQFGQSVWRRPLIEVFGIETISSEIPSGFAISQNHPNPFNPTTNFEFRIAEFGFVNLTIYDVMGRSVETLQHGEMKPGVYKAEWNASGYPSGVYFYRLSSGSFTETRKMVLIK